MKSINQNHYYNHGIDTKVAFVFSAPGKLELYNNRPVVGETGVILENLLKRIKIDEFNGLNDEIKINRYKFRITNSWPEPLYKKKNNRTEAKVTELREEKNKKRLLKELGDIEKYIFVFGKKAKSIIALLEPELKALQVIYDIHLGLMSMNQINEDVKGNKFVKGGDTNTSERLNVIAKRINEKIENL